MAVLTCQAELDEFADACAKCGGLVLDWLASYPQGRTISAPTGDLPPQCPATKLTSSVDSTMAQYRRERK